MDGFLVFLAFIATIICIIVFVIFIQALNSINKIRELLEEVIDSGAIPKVLEYRINQPILRAKKMVKNKNAFAPSEVEEMVQYLSTLKQDEEVTQLVVDLKAVLKTW
jgi:uncharacterized protein YfkK (UPF0435 family)